MPSPFPGMDPWLEAPDIWPGIHDTLIIKTVEVLQPQLRPRGYFATPGERVWLAEPSHLVLPDAAVIARPTGRAASAPSLAAVIELDEPVTIDYPTVEVHEGFVEIYETSGNRLVTGIEFLSPTNKCDYDGRRLYERKQRELKDVGVNLVEIDLIRRGPHVLDVPESVLTPLHPFDYLVNIGRRGGGKIEVDPMRLRDRLPRIRIPLKAGESDAGLPLQDLIAECYELLALEDRLDYAADPPAPPLSDEDAAWADGILRTSGLRT